MDGRSRSPVAAGPQEIFADLRAVADRVREGLAREVPESAYEPPADQAPGEEIARFAAQERARVLEAGARGLEKLAAGRDDEVGDDESFGMEAIVLLEGRPRSWCRTATSRRRRATGPCWTPSGPRSAGPWRGWAGSRCLGTPTSTGWARRSWSARTW
ncbi:hypothetical protein [Streptomyces somaliensis]|uniref:hypothetical protein n=1 Tax=Streptomyces somaliensis TaxID=78355 RepID=UPI0027E3D524|nr:hypothetical protein [Streptomyces somaliensis]